MALNLEIGSYTARLATHVDDVTRAQVFRGRVFRGAQDGMPDVDQFDARCAHILIEVSGQLVGCFRCLIIPQGALVDTSYSAQFYGLDAFATLAGCKMEVGRFCIDPTVQDPDILRLAWAAIAQMVDAQDVRYLFGCSSFEGTDVAAFRDAFALLKTRHLAPADWRPAVKADQVYGFADALHDVRPDIALANKGLPPLLRTYLSLGGLVSDHAVIDADLNTVHVFTSVAIATIPERRKQALRALV